MLRTTSEMLTQSDLIGWALTGAIIGGLFVAIVGTVYTVHWLCIEKVEYK